MILMTAHLFFRLNDRCSRKGGLGGIPLYRNNLLLPYFSIYILLVTWCSAAVAAGLFLWIASSVCQVSNIWMPPRSSVVLPKKKPLPHLHSSPFVPICGFPHHAPVLILESVTYLSRSILYRNHNFHTLSELVLLVFFLVFWKWLLKRNDA
jgi:hypothetical protein